MAVWMDKTLICLWCCSACHHHHHQQLASESYSVHFSRREWMNPLWNRTGWPARRKSANEVAFLPGAQLCSCLILSEACPTNGWRHMCTCGSCTDRDMCRSSHEHTTTAISSQRRGQAGWLAVFGSVWILAFPQLGAAGPALFIRHPSRCQFGLWDQAPRVIRPLPCLPAGPPDGLLSGPRRTKSKHIKKKEGKKQYQQEHGHKYTQEQWPPSQLCLKK